MKQFRFALVLAAAGLLAFSRLHAVSPDVREFVLFAGGDTDSTEQASRWISVRGAQRVIIRTWSTHLAFGSNADTTLSDSVTTFNVLLSDSVSFMGRDSLGTLVTASSGIPRVVGSHSEPFPVCADSVIVPVTSVGDTIYKMVNVASRPINRPLRGAQNGSGVWTLVAPILPVNTTTMFNDMRSAFGTGYLRVRTTPLRRMTISGFSSTAGKRVNGLRGLKMIAYVYYSE
jgi:hypothetical protein